VKKGSKIILLVYAAKKAENGKIYKKKNKETTKGRTKAAGYLSWLLELHRLQGVLLAQLH